MKEQGVEYESLRILLLLKKLKIDKVNTIEKYKNLKRVQQNRQISLSPEPPVRKLIKKSEQFSLIKVLE